ncbi:MAG: adenylate/guanylate cyclase domain-containing protein [Marivibrio sp.]|uniref:adenylate/guanylate cyclase domain-containing protein n=1 Tax=Marivibrio sp. TaxID=2039719 RepID=UPI0032EB3D2D
MPDEIENPAPEALSLLPEDAERPSGACIAALSAEGWSMTPVIDWLFGPGCRTADIGGLLAGLGRALIQAGAPVMRLRLGLWAIHPQQAAYSYLWMRGQARAEALNVGHGLYQSPDFIGSPAQKMRDAGRGVRYRLDRLDPARDHSVLFSVRDAGATDYIGLPMETFAGRKDFFFIATDRPEGFTDADIAKFQLLARLLLPVVESLAQHQLSLTVLDTYLGKRTGARVLAGEIRRGEGQRIEAALWYCDLRDFTAMTETVEEQAMLGLMNAYFEHVHESVSVYGGEVLRFIGDAMLIVFATDDGRAAAAACADALAAARDAIDRLPALNARLKRQKLPAIRFGIGLHEGSVVYGNVGAADRLDFTVMGPAVNRTARIETLTKRLETPILMSEGFAAQLPASARWERLGAFEVPGVAEPIAVCRPTEG